MSTETQQPQAEAAAPVPTPDATTNSVNAAIDQLFTAQITGTSPAGGTIANQLASTLAPQEPAPVVVEPNEQQPEPAAPAVPAEPEPEPPGDTPAPDADDDADPSDRIRLGSYDEGDKALIKAAHVLAKGQKISFQEAFARVSGYSQPQAVSEPEPAAPVIPPQIAALETEVADLEAKLDEIAAKEEVFGPGSPARRLRKQHLGTG